MTTTQLYCAPAACAILVVATGCGSAHHVTKPQPPWVKRAVTDIRREFVGQPTPTRISWGIGPKKRWVTLAFARSYICGGCSWPSNAHPVKGKRATMFFDIRTGEETDFGVMGR